VEFNRALTEKTDVDELVRVIVSQVQLLPLAPETISTGCLFRILTLDGGGIRGVSPLLFWLSGTRY
jgi:hypothetical protein